jgi:hypothetical protein
MEDNNPALDFIALLHHSQVILENDVLIATDALNTAFDQAKKAAISNNKAASVTLQVTVNPERQGSVSVVVSVNNKLPKAKALSLQLFTDNRGRLFCEDPRQSKMQFDAENVVPINAQGGK